MLPEEWGELLFEFAEWCGIPLKLNKALHGDLTTNRSWDSRPSIWLVKVYGFLSCLSEPSIFIKKQNDHKLLIVNAVNH